MDFLPIKYLRNEDEDRVDESLIKLAVLERNDLPVLKGIVFFPPNFKEAFRKFFVIDQGSYKNRKTELIKQFKSPPESFIEEISQKDKKINVESLWLNLINKWLVNFEKICRTKDFQRNNLSLLKGIPVFFANKIGASGLVNVYKDFTFLTNSFDTKIKIEKGELEAKNLKELDELAIKAEKILGLGFSFRWVLEEINHTKRIFFTGISYANQNLPMQLSPIRIDYSEYKDKKTETLFPVKIILNDIAEDVSDKLDGLLLNISQNRKEEELKFIINKAEKFPNALLLLKFTEEDFLKQKFLKEKSEDFLFLRNKKKLLNVLAVAPAASSVDELLRVKRDLAVLGIIRKGSLKIWIEIKSPSNIIDLENYVLAGIDGVVLNLDSLFKNLFTLEDFQKINQEKIETFIKFIDEGLRILKKLKIPVIGNGELVDNDEILRYLISEGVYGIAISPNRHKIFLMDLPWIHMQAQKNLLS